jgi:hypothetical protein
VHNSLSKRGALHDDDLAGVATFKRLVLQAKSLSSKHSRQPILEWHGRHVLQRKEPQADVTADCATRKR